MLGYISLHFHDNTRHSSRLSMYIAYVSCCLHSSWAVPFALCLLCLLCFSLAFSLIRLQLVFISQYPRIYRAVHLEKIASKIDGLIRMHVKHDLFNAIFCSEHAFSIHSTTFRLWLTLSFNLDVYPSIWFNLCNSLLSQFSPLAHLSQHPRSMSFSLTFVFRFQ